MSLLLVDSGIERVRVRRYADDGAPVGVWSFPAGGTLIDALGAPEIAAGALATRTYLVGKLAAVVQSALGAGTIVPYAAAHWMGTRTCLAAGAVPLAAIDLSASGYVVTAIDQSGSLWGDTPQVNSRCGAGPGANLDRVLQKLAVGRAEVDDLLAAFLGVEGAARRADLPTRADRCGVFASSATISDKNQGVPLDHALAVTIKSEVLKPCRKVPAGTKRVILSGGVFSWAFARDCAADALLAQGVQCVEHDREGDLVFAGLQTLAASSKAAGGAVSGQVGSAGGVPAGGAAFHPGFEDVRRHLSASALWQRLDEVPVAASPAVPGARVDVALDVGSTMAKAVVASADDGVPVLVKAYSNAGDTIETVKAFMADVDAWAGGTANVRSVGITGSARYQVQQALLQVYPALAGRVRTLVENVAHALGSVDLARAHVESLRRAGHDVDDDLCVLVDIGGEDTKISTITLAGSELFDNAMNLKCSAGTGSLMDTLASLFRIASIESAYARAARAPRGRDITATCAVFLMESARRLQAEGCPEDEILASACWAVVENMARTLWGQIRLPPRSVVLLHGQTMRSDPLPLAVALRLQQYAGQPMYCLVPPYPGHRACFGLLREAQQRADEGFAAMRPADFIGRQYRRRLLKCEGAVCGDPEALCHRVALTDGALRFTVGGCTAINEVISDRRERTGGPRVPDAYRRLWQMADEAPPRSAAAGRLVIPRAFAVSEWALFLARVFAGLGLEVHVDNVQPGDVLLGQPQFQIDTCAPHLGAVGQMLRLADEAHGMILAPQIEFLPIGGKSLGRTCTINQGGLATARALALAHNPAARIHLFYLNLRQPDFPAIALEIHRRCQPVFRYYGVSPEVARIEVLVGEAWAARQSLRTQLATRAAEYLREARAGGLTVGLVLGREYILNPGLYDSHAGRLLADKGIMALPGWLLDVEADERFDHLYWRNPHLQATLVNAVVRRELHARVRQGDLAAELRRIEEGDGTPLALVFVSTFQCGPDSVTLPLLEELARDRPFLVIQSDAAIKELAHLENRVNTHAHQLHRGLHRERGAPVGGAFAVSVLDDLVAAGGVDKERDVLCVPTLSDNRFLTSVLRSAGFSCPDNYDESHDLRAAIRAGRSAAGEAVCAPLAAVYGDTLNTLRALNARRLAEDPALVGRQRVVMINSKGLGPCRQGQYVEMHKLFFHRLRTAKGPAVEEDGPAEMDLRFLVALENRGFDMGLGREVLLRGVQGVILQGVMHQMYFAAERCCTDPQRRAELVSDYRATKGRLFDIQEQYAAPAGALARVLGFLGYRQRLKRELAGFAARWRPPAGRPATPPVRVHVDGETYMRVAQVEEIFEALRTLLPAGALELTYTPLWSFLDYKLAGIIMRSRDTAGDHHARLQASGDAETRRAVRRWRKRVVWRYLRTRFLHALLRHYLAAPLYRSGRVAMPTSMTTALDRAGTVIPTRRPGGELVPYVGEVLHQLELGVDLVLNVAPEGCMVSTMAAALTPGIRADAAGAGQVQQIFSAQGDLDQEVLVQALLKAIGPERLRGAAG